ncbi:response regulator [Streptomyces sp. NPDC058676]|uniref:response regulator n=1 Tax=unclassified Streptomyces TaxID=2593676 RepID=UPI0036509DFE
MTGTSGSRTGRVRVLLVDDEPTLTEVLPVAVAGAGRRSCPAADGHSALRVARRSAPHAVALDGMLPDLDGPQVPRRPRQGPPKPPVLMLTAREAPEHSPRREIDEGRTPMIHTVRGPGHAIRPTEEGR